MTATQYLRLYDFFKQQLNIDDAKARVFAEEIESIVEHKFQTEKGQFGAKADVQDLKYEILLLRQEMKTGFIETESILKTEFNRQIVWLIATMFTMSALIITVIKLLF